MENLTGGTPPVRYLPCVVPCKLYFLAGSILFSLAACGENSESKDEDKKNNTEAVENVDANNGDEADIGGENDGADEDGVKVGEYITFGTYEQDNNTSNGKEPIEWLVLDEQDGKVLVISKYALDAQPFNEEDVDVTWETCTVRNWLNGEFINSAFINSERVKISTVTVTADANPDYNTDPGNDTQDKVFLLNIAEANEYFDSGEARVCKATDYAVAQGAGMSDIFGYEGNCWWWLRSPGRIQVSAAAVDYDGRVGNEGGIVINSHTSIRPAMWIEL